MAVCADRSAQGYTTRAGLRAAREVTAEAPLTDAAVLRGAVCACDAIALT